MFMAAVPVQEDEEAGEPGGVGGSVEGSHRRWASRGGVATPLITFGFAAVLILFFVGVRGFETKACGKRCRVPYVSDLGLANCGDSGLVCTGKNRCSKVSGTWVCSTKPVVDNSKMYDVEMLN
mmetsp:Transcript_127424/g.271669  ORF Transcript_127424/g.271669 Transcript_127424/m.271669 type:complete len:123 (-) Transcript_127424:171-539(-)